MYQTQIITVVYHAYFEKRTIYIPSVCHTILGKRSVKSYL